MTFRSKRESCSARWAACGSGAGAPPTGLDARETLVRTTLGLKKRTKAAKRGVSQRQCRGGSTGRLAGEGRTGQDQQQVQRPDRADRAQERPELGRTPAEPELDELELEDKDALVWGKATRPRESARGR